MRILFLVDLWLFEDRDMILLIPVSVFINKRLLGMWGQNIVTGHQQYYIVSQSR